MSPPMYLIAVVRVIGFSTALLQAANAWAIPPTPIIYTVNDVSDAIDNNLLDGQCLTIANKCTLRAAVMQANDALDNTIPIRIVVPAGVYKLTIDPTVSDLDDSGDLNLAPPPSGTPTLTISGAGAGVTIIDGNLKDRVFSVEGSRSVAISGVTIRNGVVSGAGGGIYNFGSLTLSDSEIVVNSAAFGAGIENQGTLTVTDVVLSGNIASSTGGGIYNYGTLSVSQSVLSDNKSTTDGAGIANYGVDSSTLDLVTLSGNKASSYGGGIYNGATLTITRSTLSSNSAVYHGGAIYSTVGATLNIGTSTISDNAGTVGGGIANSGALFVTNSTLSQNQTVAEGGAIFNDGTSNVYNSTIAYNTAGFGSGLAGYGGGVANGGTFNVRNSIVAANYSPAQGFYDDCMGTVNSYGINRFLAGLAGSTAHCTVVQLDSGNHNALVSLLGLGSLKDNGGPTKTIALVPISNSDVIDKADAVLGCIDKNSALLAIDQRGRARIIGAHCDIGAFEYDPGDIFSNGFQ
jgi:predicted outer membrane repeat protein